MPVLVLANPALYVTVSVKGANYPESSCLAVGGTHVAGRKKILRMHIKNVD